MDSTKRTIFIVILIFFLVSETFASGNQNKDSNAQQNRNKRENSRDATISYQQNSRPTSPPEINSPQKKAKGKSSSGDKNDEMPRFPQNIGQVQTRDSEEVFDNTGPEIIHSQNFQRQRNIDDIIKELKLSEKKGKRKGKDN